LNLIEFRAESQNYIILKIIISGFIYDKITKSCNFVIPRAISLEYDYNKIFMEIFGWLVLVKFNEIWQNHIIK